MSPENVSPILPAEQARADYYIDSIIGDRIISNPPDADPVSRWLALELAKSETQDEDKLRPVENSYKRSVNRFAEHFKLSPTAVSGAVERRLDELIASGDI